MIYWITWFILRVSSFFLFPIKVYGRENIPKHGGFIFASNHRSNLDPVIIPISCFRKCNFVAKDSLFKNKFFGWYLRRLGAFAIRREIGDVGAMKEAIKRLKNNNVLTIFPEGTRVVEDKKRDVQAGIGFIVAKTKQPVVPVYIRNSDKAMPPHSKKIYRHLITVTFGKPIEISDDLSYGQIAGKIMDEILKLRA